MVLASSSYPLLDVMWTMLVFFGWIIWIWLLITVFADLFSRHDIGGWGKAGWTIALIFLPLIGVLIYLIAEGSRMGTRRAEQAQAQQQQFDSYVRNVATDGQAADQIAKGKELLDSGAITQQEYEALKQKALAGSRG
ncbi:MAG: SHOCT domain-containing protein [Motilibacteraceae bacterium]